MKLERHARNIFVFHKFDKGVIDRFDNDMLYFLYKDSRWYKII